MRPGGFGMSRMMLRAVTDLPQPDSPTTPMVWPGATSKETRSTARTVPCSVRNSVTRSWTSSRFCAAPASERASACASAMANDDSTRALRRRSGSWLWRAGGAGSRLFLLAAHGQPLDLLYLVLGRILRRQIDLALRPVDHQVRLLLRLDELALVWQAGRGRVLRLHRAHVLVGERPLHLAGRVAHRALEDLPLAAVAVVAVEHQVLLLAGRPRHQVDLPGPVLAVPRHLAGRLRDDGRRADRQQQEVVRLQAHPQELRDRLPVADATQLAAVLEVLEREVGPVAR